MSLSTTLSASTIVTDEALVSPSNIFNSAAVDVTPSRIFISAAVDVTPSSIFNSAAVEVTPSIMFSSAAVAVTSVPPNCNPLDPSWDAMLKLKDPSAKVVLPVIVIVDPSAVMLSRAMLPTLVMFASLKEVAPNVLATAVDVRPPPNVANPAADISKVTAVTALPPSLPLIRISLSDTLDSIYTSLLLL